MICNDLFALRLVWWESDMPDLIMVFQLFFHLYDSTQYRYVWCLNVFY
jgi:hypothetical protein